MAEISRAAVGGILEVSAVRPDAFRLDLAALLHTLPVLLGDLDQPEDALAAGEEAVTIRRELAASWPDAQGLQEDNP